ncbi:hypothetical protein NHQ30_008561 [Ciborinia camelliae]|nr:hypothetical protein NHQ30_008561 [Ciborinia camelliae]
MERNQTIHDLFEYKLSQKTSCLVTINQLENEERKIKSELQDEYYGNGRRADLVIESKKARVRLPIVTKGIINPVAIRQLQDELEDTKKELETLRATRVPSKDEIILPKEMDLLGLMEVWPAVRDQILTKMDQTLSDALEEYERKFKKLAAKLRDELSRNVAASREMESKMYKTEGKLRELENIAKTYPNAPIGDVWRRIQEETYDRSEKHIMEQKRIDKPATSTQYHTPRISTYDLLNSDSSFRNNRWAKGDSRKREYDDAAQSEPGKDVKRLKAA